MNLYAILIVVIAWGASVGGSFFYGEHTGENNIIAKQSAVNDAREETRQAAEQGAADAIAKLKPVNTTIVQKTQREIRENVVYRTCVLPPSGVQLANEALTGRPAQPVGGGVVPSADGAK